MSCSTPFYLPKKVDYFGKPIPLPCGQCLACRLDKRNLWEARLKSEWKKGSCSFVTLTYDEYHVPYHDMGIYPSLRRDDVHKFIDNLKHRIKDLPAPILGVRPDFGYFVIGEYGESFSRPHYHALFFGLDFANARKLIQKYWKHGFVDVKPIKNGGIRYVLKYIDACVNSKTAFLQYDSMFRERPKPIVSRGLGKDWLISQQDNIRKYGMAKSGQKYIPVPQYHKNQLLDYSLESLQQIMEFSKKRKSETMVEGRKRGYTDYDDYMDYKRALKAQSLYVQCRKEGTPVSLDEIKITYENNRNKRLHVRELAKFNYKNYLRKPSSTIDYLKLGESEFGKIY